MTQTKDIFIISETDKIVCPPDQVFQRSDFEFIFSLGGHLVDNEDVYLSLMTTLKEIGETDFYVKENLGATITDRVTPYEFKLSTDSTLQDFNNQIWNSIDDHLGFHPWHWYVHGQNRDWGIYVAEWPTIKIIGCAKNLTSKFQAVYNVLDNGYIKIREFLLTELKSSKDLNSIETFNKNYKVGDNEPLKS